MRIKIATYNIGCGGVSPSETGFIDYLSQLINAEKIDIMTIEESLMEDDSHKSFGEMLSEKTSLTHFIDFSLSYSHVIESRKMGITILSKYPIAHYEKKYLNNPNLISYTDSGIKMISHDKGFIVADILAGGYLIKYVGGHFFPFYLFGVDECCYIEHYALFETVLNSFPESLPVVVAADFNTELVDRVMPSVFKNYQSVFDEKTRPSGQMHDYILYNNCFSVLTSYMLKDGLDHYCCICELEMV